MEMAATIGDLSTTLNLAGKRRRTIDALVRKEEEGHVPGAEVEWREAVVATDIDVGLVFDEYLDDVKVVVARRVVEDRDLVAVQRVEDPLPLGRPDVLHDQGKHVGVTLAGKLKQW